MIAVLRAVPYERRVTVTDANAPEIVDYGLTLKVISRERHRAARSSA